MKELPLQYIDLLVSEGEGTVGHVMMPLQFPPTVLRLVELLNLINNWLDEWLIDQMISWLIDAIAVSAHCA